MKADVGLRPGEPAVLIAAAVLLILCLVYGGDSANSNLGMMAAQMLAIPLLILGVVCVAQRGLPHSARWGVIAAVLIVLLPLLQLLPIPASLWTVPAGRMSLLQDLDAAGIASIDTRWTLSPSATERDAYFLLPGLALFLHARAGPYGVAPDAWAACCFVSRQPRSGICPSGRRAGQLSQSLS